MIDLVTTTFRSEMAPLACSSLALSQRVARASIVLVGLLLALLFAYATEALACVSQEAMRMSADSSNSAVEALQVSVIFGLAYGSVKLAGHVSMIAM